MLSSRREKERLLKENDALKKEVERLRKHKAPPVQMPSILKSSVISTPPTPSVSFGVTDYAISRSDIQ